MPTWLSSTLNKSAATLNGNEVIRVVDDPSGTPVSARTTIDDLKDYVSTNISAPYLTEAEASGLYQPLDADLTTLGAGGAAARSFLGLGTSDTPQFTGVNVGNASDTTVTRYGAGQLAVEGWPLAPKGGAFSGHASVVSRYRTMTSWPCGIAWQSSEDRLWCFEVIEPAHGVNTTGTQLASRVECWYTEDNGNTKLGRRTIYSDPSQRPIAGAIGNMASGRIGGILTVSDSASDEINRDVIFIYSDDNCATWTSVDLTGLTTNHFVYGMLLPLPTAYGGDDTNGFCAVTYAGTTEAKLLKTTDNGANWTSVEPLLDGDATLTNPQEPSLIFTDSGAILFARGATNLYAAKSTNLSTWSAWTDTGIVLGENPVHAVVDDDDFVHVAICDRDDFTSAVYENVVRTYRIAGSTLYSDLTALGSVTPKLEWNLGYRGIGYFQSKLVGTEWYHFVKGRESASTANAASADLVLITTAPRPSPSLTPMLPPRQLIHNPAFDLWNNGTSFLNQTATAALADRWTYFPSGATADITRVTLTEVQRLSFPHRPRYGLKLDTIGAGNVHSDFVGIHQYFYGEQFYDLLRLLQARQEIDFIVYGLGTPIPSARINLYIEYGTGGSSDTSVVGTLTTAYVANDGSYVQTARLAVGLIGDPTIGTNPHIRVVLDCSSSATAFAATLTGVFAYAGQAPDEPVVLDSLSSQLQCAMADDGTDTAGTVTLHRPFSVGTTRAITAGTIELGAASDTTLSRSAAGRLAVEGTEIAFQRVYDVRSPAYGALGDGSTNDTTAIQAALTAAGVAGGTVLVPTGTYMVTTLTVPSNVTLRGLGASSVIKQIASTTGHAVVVSGKSHVTIENLAVDGNKAAQAASNHGVSVSASSEWVTVRGCYVHDCKATGIYGSASSHLLFTGNTVENTDLCGIEIETACSQSVISHNRVDTTGEANIGFQGTGIVIEGNVCKGAGIADNITGYDAANLECAVIGNYCESSGNNGMHVGGTRGVIANNIVKSPTFHGIYVANDDLTTAADWSITGNQIYNTGSAGSASADGIHLLSVSRVAVSGNSLNTLNLNGIYLDTVQYASVTGNQITDAVQRGIYWRKSSYGTCVGNQVHSCTLEGILLTDDTVTGNTHIAINGNVVTGCGGIGIRLISLEASNSVYGNICTGNGTDAVTTTAATTRGGNNISDTFTGLDTTDTTAVVVADGTDVLTATSSALASSKPLSAASASATAIVSGIASQDAATNTAFRFESDRATPAANDRLIGQWYLSDAAGTQTEFGREEVRAGTVTDGAEEGQWRWHVMKAGTLTDTLVLVSNSLRPTTSDGIALGSTSAMWSDLFLASGGVLNWNNGNATLTHSAGLLTLNVPLAWSTTTIARNAAANMGTWYVLAQSSVAVAIPNSALTTEQTYVTVTVPAGAMGANGLLRITTVWTYTNSANNKTMRVRFGGTSGTQYTSATSTTTASLRTQCQIGNRNATNSQVGGSIVSAGFGTSTGANQTSAVDTAASVDLVISGQTASAGETLTLESYMVELYYAA